MFYSYLLLDKGKGVGAQCLIRHLAMFGIEGNGKIAAILFLSKKWCVQVQSFNAFSLGNEH
jgi:hypothetical protein